MGGDGRGPHHHHRHRHRRRDAAHLRSALSPATESAERHRHAAGARRAHAASAQRASSFRPTRATCRPPRTASTSSASTTAATTASCSCTRWLRATVLRSRTVTNLSGVLSVAPDGSKFMAGATLFDFQTLCRAGAAERRQRAFLFPDRATRATSTCSRTRAAASSSRMGSVLYSAFNIAPVQNPAARANVTQLLFNDPDNLLITPGAAASRKAWPARW